MLKHLINFYKVSSPGPCNGDVMSSSGKRRLKYLQWSTFLSATFGYVLCLPVELECSKETDCRRGNLF